MNDRQALRSILIIMANVACAPLLAFPVYGTVARVPFAGIRIFVVIMCSGLAVTSFLVAYEHRQGRPLWFTAGACVLASAMPPIAAWVWTLRDLFGHDVHSLLGSTLVGALYTASCWGPLAVGTALAVRGLPHLAGE